MWRITEEQMALRFGVGILTLLVLCASLMLALVGCGGSTEQAPPSPSSRSIEVAPPSSPAPEPPPAVQGGRVLAAADERITGFPAQVLGTQEALERWEDLAGSGKAVFLEVYSTDGDGGQLSADEAAAIADTLSSAELRLFSSLGNPITGGGIHIIGCDGEGAMLYHTVFDGSWFSVQFAGEDAAYVFDGENTTLNDLLSQYP